MVRIWPGSCASIQRQNNPQREHQGAQRNAFPALQKDHSLPLIEVQSWHAYSERQGLEKTLQMYRRSLRTLFKKDNEGIAEPRWQNKILRVAISSIESNPTSMTFLYVDDIVGTLQIGWRWMLLVSNWPVQWLKGVGSQYRGKVSHLVSQWKGILPLKVIWRYCELLNEASLQILFNIQ